MPLILVQYLPYLISGYYVSVILFCWKFSLIVVSTEACNFFRKKYKFISNGCNKFCSFRRLYITERRDLCMKADTPSELLTSTGMIYVMNLK